MARSTKLGRLKFIARRFYHDHGRFGNDFHSNGVSAIIDSIVGEELLQTFNRLRARAISGAPSVRDRRQLLKRLQAALRDHHANLVNALKKDLGKSEAESELAEFLPVWNELRSALKNLPEWAAAQPVSQPWFLLGTESWTKPEPRGVVAIFAPWNYPINLTLSPLIAAIAAGNRVLLKPSEKATHTALALYEMIERGMASEDIKVVLGGPAVSEKILELPFDHFFFTGSQAVGQKVMQAAAKQGASVTLELGGKSSTIIGFDVKSRHIRDYSKRIAWAKWLNAGQTCVAPDHVWVPTEQLGEWAPALSNAFTSFSGEVYGQLIDDAAAQRLSNLLSDALSKGAKVVCGEERAEPKRSFRPTVLTHVSMDMAVMQEEIFGPILPVMTYDKTETVLEAHRQLGKPLALYIFSNDKAWVDHLIHHTRAGSTVINEILLNMSNDELPFGGAGPSGLGRYHGKFGFDELSHLRAFMRKCGPTLSNLGVPPFSRALVQWTLKYLKRFYR